MNEIFLHDLKIIRLLNYFHRNVGLLEADIRLIWVPFRESDYNEAALWYCVLSSPPYLEVC